MMDEHNKPAWLTVGTFQCSVLCAAAGLAVAFMLLYMGFWRTLFVVLLTVAGYGMGACKNKSEKLKKLINRLFPPKGE